MKKKVEEILERNDYVRLSKNLVERVEKIAKIVRNKMYHLDIDRLTVNGVTVAITTYYNCNVGSTTFLAMPTEYKNEWNSYYGSPQINEEDELVYTSLENINEDYCVCGDYNCRLIGADCKQARLFLNNAKAILERLDEIETEQVDEVNKALKETEDIIIKVIGGYEMNIIDDYGTY